jgi:N-terminal domain of CBF1 interacting co-repressor CIR
MGKLNIAHHKSYHPYRLDNIERVRRDEEEAKLKEQGEEGRMRVAVCLIMQLLIYIITNVTWMQDSEARLDLLRGRAGGSKRVKKKEGEELEPQPMAALTTISTSSGHINLFADFEQVCQHRMRLGISFILFYS